MLVAGRDEHFVVEENRVGGVYVVFGFPFIGPDLFAGGGLDGINILGGKYSGAALAFIVEQDRGGETGLADIFHDIAERIPRRGLVIIFSDLYDDPEALINALHHFRYRRHEVILFHIVADEEINFPFDRFTKFKDLEVDGNRLAIDPRTIRATYLERMSGFLKEIEAACGRMKIDYACMNTNVPYDEALASYLMKRG